MATMPAIASHLPSDLRAEIDRRRRQLDAQARLAAQARLDAGCTMADLARELSVDRSNLSNWYHGHAPGKVGWRVLRALAG